MTSPAKPKLLVSTEAPRLGVLLERSVVSADGTNFEAGAARGFSVKSAVSLVLHGAARPWAFDKAQADEWREHLAPFAGTVDVEALLCGPAFAPKLDQPAVGAQPAAVETPVVDERDVLESSPSFVGERVDLDAASPAAPPPAPTRRRGR